MDKALIDRFATRGVSQHLRCDNGPEFIAATIRRLADLTGMETLYIAPGNLWENGFAESFHSRLRHELLSAKVFEGVREAKALETAWKHEYNLHRPHSSQGYVPPAVFAARLGSPKSPSAADAPRYAADIANVEIVWEGTDPVIITRLS